MEEVLVKYETAVIAKEKGFDWHCQCYYKRNKSLFNRSIEQDPDNWNGSSYTNDVMSAPTQSLLQKYLREQRKIHIAIMPCITPSNEVKYYIFKGKLKWDWAELFNTYEEALEEGLLNALTLIK